MSNAELIKSRNSLNTIRLLAALQVMLGHMAAFLAMPSWLEPVRHILSYFPGVPLFFTLSGYLIWNSIETSGSYRQYLGKRFLRIYPELWASVILEIGSILCLYWGSVSLPELAAFTFGQATVFQFWKPYSLTGFGCGTPNGALWTIPVLVVFYVVVWWVHRLLHQKGLVRWLAGFLLCAAVSLLVSRSEAFLPEILYKLLRYSVIPHFWLFYVGMFAAEYVQYLLENLKKYWFFCLLAVFLLHKLNFDMELGYYPLLESVLLFFGWLGFAYRLPGLNIRKDISYGLYISHMIVVNILLELFGSQKLWLIPAAVGISVVIAWVSTTCIGKYTRKLKARFCQPKIS